MAFTAAAPLSSCGGAEGPAPRPAPHGHGVLVEYERTGGIAGSRERLTVRGDGTSTLVQGGLHPRRQRFLLPRRLTRRLARLIHAGRLDRLRPRYGPERPVADGVTEMLRSAGRSVRIESGVPPPSSLQPALALLGEIVARAPILVDYRAGAGERRRAVLIARDGWSAVTAGASTKRSAKLGMGKLARLRAMLDRVDFQANRQAPRGAGYDFKLSYGWESVRGRRSATRGALAAAVAELESLAADRPR